MLYEMVLSLQGKANVAQKLQDPEKFLTSSETYEYISLSVKL